MLIYPDDSDPHELLKANYINYLTHSICDVQPMTKETIGDPTRGYENIFTISYWSLKYEDKQYDMWDDDGGIVI